MVQSNAKSVKDYLDELPPARRAVVAKVREIVRKNLPAGFEEAMAFGMIGWQVPLARYPETYNGQPLLYAALAAQKNAYSLYLMGCYMDPPTRAALIAASASAGKGLDMGKSCIRFRELDELPIAALGKAVASVALKEFIAHHEKAHPPKAVGKRATARGGKK
jgi:Domain of unknown function (DU1801)